LNILFFLTPKATCSFLYSDFTVRQALETMEHDGYAAMPILDRQGQYIGSLTEGDLLWACKNMCGMDLKRSEGHSIMEIKHRRDNKAVTVNTRMEDLFQQATEQNFVPVVDDSGTFIGIITRRSIMRYCAENFINK